MRGDFFVIQNHSFDHFSLDFGFSFPIKWFSPHRYEFSFVLPFFRVVVIEMFRVVVTEVCFVANLLWCLILSLTIDFFMDFYVGVSDSKVLIW